MTPDEMKHFREVGDIERNAMRMVAFAEIERRRVEDCNNMLKDENEKLREIVEDWYPHMLKRVGPTALAQWGYIKTMVELGMDIYPLNEPEPSKSED